MTSNDPRLGRRLRRLAPAIVILILAATACGPFRRGAGPAPAVLYVTNESLHQATLYLAAPGVGFRRIGTVFAGRTETITVPVDLVARGGTLNIVARLLASSAVPQSGPVSILAGERYEVRLLSDGRLISFLPAGS